MATTLYKLVDGSFVSEIVQGQDVGYLLTIGYSVSPKVDIISDEQVKIDAKIAGIRIGRKSIATLKSELGYE